MMASDPEEREQREQPEIARGDRRGRPADRHDEPVDGTGHAAPASRSSGSRYSSQYRHFRATARIRSPQNGQLFISSGVDRAARHGSSPRPAVISGCSRSTSPLWMSAEASVWSSSNCRPLAL